MRKAMQKRASKGATAPNGTHTDAVPVAPRVSPASSIPRTGTIRPAKPIVGEGPDWFGKHVAGAVVEASCNGGRTGYRPDGNPTPGTIGRSVSGIFSARRECVREEVFRLPYDEPVETRPFPGVDSGPNVEATQWPYESYAAFHFPMCRQRVGMSNGRGATLTATTSIGPHTVARLESILAFLRVSIRAGADKTCRGRCRCVHVRYRGIVGYGSDRWCDRCESIGPIGRR